MRDCKKKIMFKDFFNDFSGFKSINHLKEHKEEIPEKRGVYLVLYCEDSRPKFLHKGTGGFYKRKDPNSSIDELKENWIDDEPIIYIGKAGGKKYKTNLRTRLEQYFKFGSGKSAPHRGGRYIWQVKNSSDLIVAWKITRKEPLEVEKKLICKFKREHGGRRPFANMRG